MKRNTVNSYMMGNYFYMGLEDDEEIFEYIEFKVDFMNCS